MTAHIPVLVNEMLNYLQPVMGNSFIDATFGAGGYTKKILAAGAKKVFALDQDPNTVEFAAIYQKEYGTKFTYINDNFRNLSKLYEQKIIDCQVDGIVFDLGVSSMQLDTAQRGFSFSKQAKLDMRMSGQGKTVQELINTASEGLLADIIYQYGEEPRAKRIAREIINYRTKKLIETTTELANIIHKVIPYRTHIDSATRSFQAFRIYVNDELNALKEALAACEMLLKPEGRLVTITFHSLEDKIVKDFLKANSPPKQARSKYKPQIVEQVGKFKICTNKVITPSAIEIKSNFRARSARLRAAIKLPQLGGDSHV